MDDTEIHSLPNILHAPEFFAHPHKVPIFLINTGNGDCLKDFYEQKQIVVVKPCDFASVHQRQDFIKAPFTRSFIVVLSGAKLRR